MRAVMPWMPWFLVACSEFGLDPIDDPDPPPELVVVQETFVQQARPALDVLFVVDASPSMAQELDALADGVGGLVEALDAAGVGWQLGVVTAAGRNLSGDDVASGRLLGAPWVLTSHLPGVEDAFADALPEPSVLAGEGGIASAIAALEEARDGVNLGFRREGAALLVVFVSDDDDASNDLLDDPPAQALAATFAEEEALYGASARASGLVGDVPNGCSSSLGSARPAPRYHQVVAESDGVVGSVCSLDFAPVLEGVAEGAVDYPAVFPLAQVPASDDVQVDVDGVPAEGWVLEVEGREAAVRFDAPPAPAARIDVRYVVSNTATGTSAPEADATVATEPEAPQ